MISTEVAEPEPGTDDVTSPRLLTPSQAAKRLGVCTKTLRNWRNRGAIRAVMLGPTTPRYHVSEVSRIEDTGVPL